MGRTSKLSPDKWNEIQRRVLEGEKIRPLAREYGIAESAVREKISVQTAQIKTVAHQIVATEKALAALPINAQINAQSLASKLRAISDNLANAAHYSAMNAHKLSKLANAQLVNIEEDPTEDWENLKGISVLTSMANEASKIPMGLLNANKEQMQKLEDTSASGLKELSDHELFAIASGSS